MFTVHSMFTDHSVRIRNKNLFVDGVSIVNNGKIDDSALARIAPGLKLSDSIRMTIIASYKQLLGVSPKCIPAGNGTFVARHHVRSMAI